MNTFDQAAFPGAMPSAASPAPTVATLTAWLPALLGLSVIFGESTNIMGADHTMAWLGHSCAPLAHLAHTELVRLNTFLRKGGHFLGYGMLGVLLMQAWAASLAGRVGRSWKAFRYRVAALGVFSVSLVASADEIHQHFLPSRTGCFSDVLLDTSGAMVLIALISALLVLRRRRAMHFAWLQTVAAGKSALERQRLTLSRQGAAAAL